MRMEEIQDSTMDRKRRVVMLPCVSRVSPGLSKSVHTAARLKAFCVEKPNGSESSLL